MIRTILMGLSAIALLTVLTTEGLAKEITIRGKLQRTIEAGGWLVVTEKEKYLILNPKKFQSEKWFAEATEVEATGEEKSGVVTIYMQGRPFEVHSMRPIKQDESALQIQIYDNGPLVYTSLVYPLLGLCWWNPV